MIDAVSNFQSLGVGSDQYFVVWEVFVESIPELMNSLIIKDEN